MAIHFSISFWRESINKFLDRCKIKGFEVFSDPQFTTYFIYDPQMLNEEIIVYGKSKGVAFKICFNKETEHNKFFPLEPLKLKVFEDGHTAPDRGYYVYLLLKLLVGSAVLRIRMDR